MGNKSEKAVEYFLQGYNCAQAVFLAFSNDYGLDEETALKLSSSFGGGMGRLREVCGAVSSMFAIAGLKEGYISPNDKETKTKHYALIQKLAEEFKKHHGSIVCREILKVNNSISPIPDDRTPDYYKNRPCARCVETAAKIIESL